ncbi:MAG: SpoIIE family protein phosphatase [Pseudomonadota bacterium]
MTSPMKVLVVDDVQENLTLLSRALGYEGYVVVVAKTGEEALSVFAAERPDVVLMDVMLPGIDGYEATRRLRRLSGQYWVPIIFVSALGQSVDMVRGLEAGGDDYIGKPIDLSLLLAKMRAMQRIAEMQRRLRETRAELAAYHLQAEEEQEMARELMARMIDAASMEIPGMRQYIQPAGRFCGDLLIATRSQSGEVYVLHADSMGHGLAAALPLLPISQTFHSMSQQGMSIADIAREMNLQLHRQMPQGRFVAATLVRLDPVNHVAEVWNGGNPAALMLDASGRVLQRFASQHMALGPLGANRFDARTQIVQAGQSCSLVLFSDGLLDAVGETGAPFGEEGVEQALLARGANLFDELVEAVQRLAACGGVQDDISVVSLAC